MDSASRDVSPSPSPPFSFSPAASELASPGGETVHQGSRLFKPQSDGQHRQQDEWARMSAGGALHLDHAERRQRQQAAAVHAIRQIMHSHRHLFGENISTVQQLFRAMDTDRSGRIEQTEFHAALTRLGLGLTTQQLNELWQGFDLDGDGAINYTELRLDLGLPHRYHNKPPEPQQNQPSELRTYLPSGIELRSQGSEPRPPRMRLRDEPFPLSLGRLCYALVEIRRCRSYHYFIKSMIRL